MPAGSSRSSEQDEPMDQQHKLAATVFVKGFGSQRPAPLFRRHFKTVLGPWLAGLLGYEGTPRIDTYSYHYRVLLRNQTDVAKATEAARNVGLAGFQVGEELMTTIRLQPHQTVEHRKAKGLMFKIAREICDYLKEQRIDVEGWNISTNPS
jgi:hypothetical protein